MKLEKIIIGSEAKKPLHYVDSVQVVKGLGLEGDRYFYKKGTFNKLQLSQDVREVSLIDFDTLGECNERLESALGFLDLRRNLVITNLNTNISKGTILTIGKAQFKIVRTCPPCRYLSKLLDEDMMQGLKYIGGYRAKIIQSGLISVGDDISI